MNYKIKCAGVYVIEVGNFYYIGKSVSIFDRFNTHYSNLMKGVHHSKKLQNAFNQVGITKLKFRVLETFNITDLKAVTQLKGKELEKAFDKLLLEKEKEWMKKYSVKLALNSDNKFFN